MTEVVRLYEPHSVVNEGYNWIETRTNIEQFYERVLLYFCTGSECHTTPCHKAFLRDNVCRAHKGPKYDPSVYAARNLNYDRE